MYYYIVSRDEFSTSHSQLDALVRWYSWLAPEGIIDVFPFSSETKGTDWSPSLAP